MHVIKKIFVGSMSLFLAGCQFNPFHNDNGNVYGPPTDFDPSSNQNEEVYGPPPEWEEEANEKEE